MTVRIESRGLKDTFRFFDALPEVAERAACLAINDVASKKGMTHLKRVARSQVNFPKGYLEKNDRLSLYKRALPGRPEAVIRARDRATSLARFALGGQFGIRNSGRGVTLQVSARARTTVKRAWLMRLRNGNLGLAIRVKPGESPDASTGAIPMKKYPNVWLLYGPSVDQVMQDVYKTEGDALFEMIEREFNRQFLRLSRAA